MAAGWGQDGAKTAKRRLEKRSWNDNVDFETCREQRVIHLQATASAADPNGSVSGYVLYIHTYVSYIQMYFFVWGRLSIIVYNCI